ncbi:hypothetical protein KPH14_008106 [Odynerus spinipes]|uniref:Choline/carnitine acyltransferase domain-containing protein n=1 Tax=Odynerus spinipes TaxID=1348599 RepID=A0AAD9RLD9_9HYME|nr:hypothetical protein KPH14_008106 [Odynerus spinipes]
MQKILSSSVGITTLNLNKQTLPKQPVPDLGETTERYLKSVKPFLTENEYCKTKRIVKEFISEDGPGCLLQSKLLERYEKTDNWLSEWWLNSAYLGYRAPVIVNSNPGSVGPPLKFKRKEDVYLIAGHLVRAVCDYDKMIKCGNIKQEMAGNEPLDMQPYAMILGTHRRPAPKCDQLLHTDDSKHIIIISNNNFFKLDVIKDCSVLNETEIAGAIKDIVCRSQEKGKAVGILTGNDRDTWAEFHCLLKELGCNDRILREIEQSLFILCMDKQLPKEVFKEKNSASVRAVQSLTGYNSCINAGNRWHDKTVQFILSADGFFGMEYEHSPCEGGPVAVLHDYVLKYIAEQGSGTGCDTFDKFPKAEHLKFETNATIDCAIGSATAAVDKLSKNLDMECFTFDLFGKKVIKGFQLSPDSFIQMALQATYYKLHNKPPAHYETAALRRFRNARTECIRSTSIESVKFAKAITDKRCKNEELKDMLFKAIEVHKKLASEATLGQGVDRHLYGLKMIALCESMELPELYKDIAYTKSTTFTLSSSQVPYKSTSFMCYGPVVPDGYGCCYNPRTDDILFACSSYKSCKETSSKAFADTLKEMLRRMRSIASNCPDA